MTAESESKNKLPNGQLPKLIKNLTNSVMELREAVAYLADDQQKLAAQAAAAEKKATQTEHKADSNRRVVLLSVLLTLFVIVGGFGLDQIQHSLCRKATSNRTAIREILKAAEQASQRNPLPPNLTEEETAYYEARRREAEQRYRGWINQLPPHDCETIYQKVLPGE